MKYYTLLATIQHNDGRVCKYRYNMNKKEFNTFYEKILKPQGDIILNIENIKEPMKYYS